ncbi:MAG: KH domain-containing protein [Desulfurococcaceae archaeon]|uniref:RNA-processing protein n=1 Tax=Staphylothermus marinus TaxID=2280 RepID=A0A7C4NLA9_STAMA
MSREEKGKLTLGVTKLYEKIPIERIGVLIGPNGKTLREIMDKTGVSITVDSTTGSVVIEPSSTNTTMVDLLKARDIVKAIGYGFNPEIAMELIDEDKMLVVINVKDYVGDKPNHIQRLLGRVIGEGGKAKRNIEELTKTKISIYETNISIIGDYDSIELAKTAIEMLLQGRQHSTVYRYLERASFTLKRRRMTDLWMKKL